MAILESAGMIPVRVGGGVEGKLTFKPACKSLVDEFAIGRDKHPVTFSEWQYLQHALSVCNKANP